MGITKMNNKDLLDFDAPFGERFGANSGTYRYIQDGMYYDFKGRRVNHETGALWSERDNSKVELIETLEEAGKESPQMARAAKAAKAGVVLPNSMTNKAKKK